MTDLHQCGVHRCASGHRRRGDVASPGLTVTVGDNTTTNFYATATDLAGNVAACSSPAFTYVQDSLAPAAPVITDSDPNSPANDNNPKLKGTAEASSTVRIYTNAACTGVPAATSGAAMFASPGLTVTVGDNTTTNFYATATDLAGNVSACSSPAFTYVRIRGAQCDDHAPDVGRLHRPDMERRVWNRLQR